MAARLLNSSMQGLIRENGFGPFYWRRREFLRRVFVTVRDRDWTEIGPALWNCTVDEARHSIQVRARHMSERVDFEWQGTLQLGIDAGTLDFEFEGTARKTMDVCRLGLVILHPVDMLTGAVVTTRGPNGQQVLIIPDRMAPQPIVNGLPMGMTDAFSEMVIEHSALGRTELSFGGELFELEDQRNWGDASFKTYCTPLRLGFPRQVALGCRIAHRFDLRFTPSLARPPPSTRQTHYETVPAVFPAIGREWSGSGGSDSMERDWHHLHVDLSDRGGLEDLPWELEEPPRIEIGLGDASLEKQFPQLVSWIAGHRAGIARLMLYGAGTAPPSAASITNWRRALDAAGAAGVPIFAATRGYFVEFNRSLGARLGSASGISFPLTATVHSDDPTTIAENVATIRDIAYTARYVIQTHELAIAPLALYYPSSAAREFPRVMIAPWLAATFMYAAIAGVASVTLANDVASAAPAVIIQRLLQCAGLPMTQLPDEQRKGVHAAMLHRPTQSTARIFAVNLNSTPTHLVLESLAARILSLGELGDGPVASIDRRRVEIPAFGIRWLECELK
jgi:hypothetical protein